ncbi:MAG TPA: histidine kinase [Cyclobacteriaceae bacterium]|nr:histidine kinase [Cyclobacteriaceae bacterium]
MKAKWSYHERILVGFYTILVIARLLWIARLQQHVSDSSPILLIGRVVIIAGSYALINWFIARYLRTSVKMSSYLLLPALVLAIAYVIGPVVNFGFFYLSKSFPIPTSGGNLLPIHPQPFQNTFGGYAGSVALVTFYTAYALFREFIVKRIESPGRKRSFKLMVANGITTIVVFVLTIPLLLFVLVFNGSTQFSAAYVTLVPSVVAIALMNIYWLFPAGASGPVNVKLIAAIMVCSIALTFFFYGVGLRIHSGFFMEGMKPLQGFFVTLAIVVSIAAPLSWLLFQDKKDKILEAAQVEIDLIRSRSDLIFLKSQLNPHFFFNTLNAVYATAIMEGAERTSESIQKLGSLMRFVLDDIGRDTISLNSELSHLRNYIQLQKLRVPASQDFVIEETLEEQIYDHMIIPVVFIPLMENAFKHGVAANEKSWIKVKVNSTKDTVEFYIRNSIHRQANQEKEGGIGIQNVRRRLELKYAANHELIIKEEGDEFVVQLMIRHLPLARAKGASSLIENV